MSDRDTPDVTPATADVPMPARRQPRTPVASRSAPTAPPMVVSRARTPEIRPEPRPHAAKDNPRAFDYGMKPDYRLGTPTGLPTSSCFYCGARGWCDHRSPDQ